MLYLDAKYTAILGTQLRNFKQVKPYLWNFACPVCGDSVSNKSKSRGYIFQIKNELAYKCHNCGLSTNFGNILKRVNHRLYDEYVLERYKENASKYTDHSDVSKFVNDTKPAPILEWEDEKLSSLDRLDSLDMSHPAVKYVIDRNIPEEHWDKLYFTPHFKKFVNTTKPKFEEPIQGEHPRMIIPFFKENGKMFAFQGRAYGNEQPKYYTIKVDEQVEKIYGIDRIQRVLNNTNHKPIYMVEGPIDSLFLPNSLAVAGASFNTPFVRSLGDDVVIVMDNEPRNKEIVKQLEGYIDAGYKVCMFPETIEEKDINDMIMSGKTSEEIVDLINKNTFKGMEAKLKFTKWRKI